MAARLRRHGADADPRRARFGHHRGDDRRPDPNITPGPLLFQQQPDIVWGLIASLFIANVMLIILNVPMVRVFTRILAVPNWSPGAGHRDHHRDRRVRARDYLDLFLMVGIGVLGYILRKLDFPPRRCCWASSSAGWSRTCAARCRSPTANWASSGRARSAW